MKNYLIESARTDNWDRETVRQRMQDDATLDLIHACFGLPSEVGELVDQVKKHIFYGTELDKTNLIEEAGDFLWYLAVLLRFLGTSFEEVASINLDKLKVRYAEGFSKYAAKVRNLETERKILEGGKQ